MKKIVSLLMRMIFLLFLCTFLCYCIINSEGRMTGSYKLLLRPTLLAANTTNNENLVLVIFAVAVLIGAAFVVLILNYMQKKESEISRIENNSDVSLQSAVTQEEIHNEYKAENASAVLNDNNAGPAPYEEPESSNSQPEERIANKESDFHAQPETELKEDAPAENLAESPADSDTGREEISEPQTVEIEDIIEKDVSGPCEDEGENEETEKSEDEEISEAESEENGAE